MIVTGVILDLDGVLIDTESISRKAWLQAAAEFEFDFPESFYSKIVGHSVQSARKEIEAMTDGRIDMDRYMARSADIYNGEMHNKGVDLLPGVPELLDFLSQNELKTAIATSTTWDQADWKLKKCGLYGVIADVITGDRTENGKPAPDIFLIAAKQIDTSPRTCVVIEDANAGIVGASAAGMIPIMVPNSAGANAESEKLAHSVVSTLYEAVEVLREII